MRRVFTAKSCILAPFFDGFHVAPCPELSRPPVDSEPCHDGTCSVRCRLPRAFSLHSSKDRSGNTRGMGTDFKVCIEPQFGGIEGPVLNKIATSHRVCRGIVPTEAFDEGKDVIGGLPPSERFGIGVVSINKRSDVCPEGGDAAPRLIFLSVRRAAKKRPTWLSHANWSGQVHVPARPFRRVSFFDGSVSGINEVVAAFDGQNASDEVADVVAGVVDRALLCDAHPVLDLGEDLLDRVEVG
ncbi:hypothetical protein ACVWXO_001189 [Bradyrhizobium sp. LM2.7]